MRMGKTGLPAAPTNGSAGATALLTCFAFVVTLNSIAKVPSAPATQQLVASPGAHARAGAVDRVTELTVAAVPVSSSAAGAANPSSLFDDAFANFGIPPAREQAGDAGAQSHRAPQNREATSPQPLASIVGVWVPDASACSARNFRDGFLPTVINPDGAWAGETFCLFRNQRQIPTGWRVIASCSNPHEHWTTEVRLTVNQDRLTWVSKRGTQAYTRCPSDFLVAASH
jgi:hypothetical protein